ncbi:glycosyltransferase family 2 protein [Pantoea eucrina]|uniref:glycosyltransferase family 2 protein n=1 Tax=Pantoea eucrina TaxID=472693 RepID=UPI00080F3B35|nr:glycosyltransferase [Pantoea eucrina]
MTKSSPPVLSIIIPCFNAGEFILPCLQSLFTQLEPDIEVIIIDDGSEDNSAGIIGTFLQTQQHEAVLFLQQKNCGIADTRNIGLQHARGTFVTFIDADDMISRHYIAVIRPLLLTDNDDLIDFNYARFERQPPEEMETLDVKRIAYDFQSSGVNCLEPLFKKSMWHLWNRVYRRALLSDERFASGRRYEDVIFTPFIYFKTDNIAHLDNTLYFYRDNKSGITRNVRKSDIADLTFAMQKMLIWAEKKDKAHQRLASFMVLDCFNEIKTMSKIVYGYYYYEHSTLALFRSAAVICQGNCRTKKYLQLRFPQVDTFFSYLNGLFRKRRSETHQRA